jgi:hypothetical protein
MSAFTAHRGCRSVDDCKDAGKCIGWACEYCRTPRTDAKQLESAKCDTFTHAHYGWKFARQLEREISELQEALRVLVKQLPGAP